MLDLDHPFSKYVFASARSLDAILSTARNMTFKTQQDRARLRQRCIPHFAFLRQLAKDHFAAQAAIPDAIADLEKSIASLASLPNIPTDGLLPERGCSSCNAKLIRRNQMGYKVYFRKPTRIYCSKCLEIIWPSLSILNSSEKGFGTDVI